MVDRNVVTAKLAELADRIARVRANRPDTLEQLRADRNAFDLVAFNLMLAVQACLDLASHFIADEGWPAASSFAESFQRLATHEVIRQETADTLAEAAKFRNIVAHGYILVQPDKVFVAATSGLGDLESFASQVGVWIEERGE